jgi:hypothetical protein
LQCCSYRYLEDLMEVALVQWQYIRKQHILSRKSYIDMQEMSDNGYIEVRVVRTNVGYMSYRFYLITSLFPYFVSYIPLYLLLCINICLDIHITR